MTGLFLRRALAAAALAIPVWSQTTTGDILGTVLDESSAGMGGAKITVRNLQTNATKETVS